MRSPFPLKSASLRRLRLRLLSLLLLTVVCLSLLAACGSGASGASDPALLSGPEAVLPSLPPLPEKAGLRIAVASDLHLNPDNRPSGEGDAASAYSLELADALLRDVERQGANFLLLTGDLCNGGKQHRHEALIRKLRDAEASGLPVYVLPGNHDLAPILQTDFAELYSDFGYTEAFSRDPVSLSYCVVRDGLMILMMDTAGYSTGAINLSGAEAPDSSNPFLSSGTLRWTERMLETAREKDLRVLAAGHYNLLPEIARDPENIGYYLVNGDRFSELLHRYGVTLYLSGHAHTRAVYQEDGLTELTTEYLLAYPAGYSILDLTDSGIQYSPRRVDVDFWAKESGQTDPFLLNFSQWQQDGLLSYAEENIRYMSERNPISAEEKVQAAVFFYRTMNAFWLGTLSRESAEIRSMRGYEPFFRCAEGYAYGWWLKSLIDSASPKLAGFQIPWAAQGDIAP